MHIISTIVAVSAVLSVAAAAKPDKTHNKPAHTTLPQLRILALGDSITAGWGEKPAANSYRRYLECYLSVRGYPVEFVGSQKSGDWPNNVHEGYPGKKIAEIGKLADGAIKAADDANVVLIHAGTNDIIKNDDVVNAPKRLFHLVNDIVKQKPNATIVVSQIILTADKGHAAKIQTFNKEVAQLIMHARNDNKNIRGAGFQTITGKDLADGIHPTPGGYDKMAASFLNAISRATRTGHIPAIQGKFTDMGEKARPKSGTCHDLKA